MDSSTGSTSIVSADSCNTSDLIASLRQQLQECHAECERSHAALETEKSAQLRMTGEHLERVRVFESTIADQKVLIKQLHADVDHLELLMKIGPSASNPSAKNRDLTAQNRDLVIQNRQLSASVNRLTLEKSNLLQDAQTLQAKILALEATVAHQSSTILELKAKIAAQDEKIAGLETAFEEFKAQAATKEAQAAAKEALLNLGASMSTLVNHVLKEAFPDRAARRDAFDVCAENFSGRGRYSPALLSGGRLTEVSNTVRDDDEAEIKKLKEHFTTTKWSFRSFMVAYWLLIAYGLRSRFHALAHYGAGKTTEQLKAEMSQLPEEYRLYAQEDLDSILSLPWLD
ncbi:hypothetical protein CAOG_06425 [Capsaspora owczarzaki ATCC 30864]|uniref:Uncharacterized protein n=1 Tax=Capsaspora owczarzaki (strain ATCC 30864) TaxID=595528 RepID=A0A0D2ULT5_CAPO3|nr:hypothetical protein CAOG_06425 [Capsaspora owczarzaki ATCC 30864]KJE96051.1 hypothetical protein CAOG_006425 [Capsaspora owczarzaki ATCC 30864]|eukprot:XP_004345174.1 hypothetical protein CAOG_06425 [Capsaspora owczarzaki ATCC 30864]